MLEVFDGEAMEACVYDQIIFKKKIKDGIARGSFLCGFPVPLRVSVKICHLVTFCKQQRESIMKAATEQ